MKKRMILVTLSLIVITVIVSTYISTRKTEPLFAIENLPTSKPHKHFTPDGTTVKHHHTYTLPDPSKDIVKHGLVSEAKHPIQSAWERLDLEAIKRKYQPYTVAEMQEMWAQWYRGEFPESRYPYELDEAYPQVKWLERNLALGQHFVKWSDYRLVLQRRIYMVNHQRKWSSASVDEKEFMLKSLDLPSSVDTWEEYEDAYLKFYIVSFNAFQEATEADPDIEGGTVGADGTFIPFKANTVYTHINPENGLSTFTGVELNEKEERDLAMYGIVPEGLTVIYTDEKGNPLPPDVLTPRLYERRMKSLEEAQARLQQQIKEHEFLLEMDTLLNPSEDKKQTVTSPHDHRRENDPEHTHEAPQTHERSPSKQQQQQPNVRQLPPGMEVPPDLHTQDEINHWFTALEALHGGQLPKDLQALKKVITELEQIRQEGERRLQPERPEPPAPPSPPEGSSPPTSNEDD